MKTTLLTFLNKLKDGYFKDLDQAKPVIRSRHISNTHWVKLPNVKTFTVKTTGSNSIFKYFGITKSNNPVISWDPYRNAKYNIYMSRQIRRLRSYKNSPLKFFRIMLFLIAKSKVFRVSAINKSIPRWYKNASLGAILSMNRKVNKIISNMDTNLIFHRVYIPKGEDSWRPLGVPSPEWRVVLQMVNNFMAIFLEDMWLKSQHGFIAGRGTLTAWQEVLKIQKAKYIYEYDLKDYFNQINLSKVIGFLDDKGVPHEFTNWLLEVNRCLPQLPNLRKIPEAHHDSVTAINEFNNLGSQTSLYEWETFSPRETYTGVPQGSNTGPLLSLIPLLEFLKQGPSVSYADDGLFYSDKPFEIKSLDSWGVHLHPEKSGWVKKDGEWIKPIKFLGLIWDGESLRASTRKGSTLVADNMKEAWSLITSINLRSLSANYNLTWEQIFKAQFGGTVISKLYNGTWTIDDIFRRFNFHPGPKTVLAREKRVNLFNASSYASFMLIRILTNQERSPGTLTQLNRCRIPRKQTKK